jgi:hypothetical protein
MADMIDNQVILATLKAKRAALDQAISAMEAFISGEAPGGGSNSSGGESSMGSSIQPDTFVGMNIAEAASRYLHITGRPAKSTEGISEALNHGGLNCTLTSVSAILRRNNNSGEGDVIRVGRGLWGLQEWYPGRPRRSNRTSGEEGE